MTTTQFVSLAAFILPTYISVKFNVRGIIYGGLCLWASFIGIFFIFDNPEGLGWIGSIFWILVGWPIGIFYCTLASLLINLLIKLFRAITKPRR